MSVLLVIQPIIMPFGQISPAQPLGTWQAAAIATGDGTGGLLRVRCTLPRPFLWSADGFSCQGSQTLAAIVEFTGGRASFGWKQTLEMVAGGTEAPTPRGRDTVRSWGGLIIGEIETDGYFAVEQANLLAATLSLAVWGFVWDRAALLQPEGPRRPRGILFEPGGG